MADKGEEGAVERILRMVSEGKVTPEQGAELLRALGGQAAGDRNEDEAEASSSRGAQTPGGGVFGRGGWSGRGGDDRFNIDLAALGRLGRHVAMRVERELDGIERSARRMWAESEDGDGDEAGPSEILYAGSAPADGRLVLDVELQNASLRVVPDPEATEVRVIYKSAVAGLVIESPPPRVRMEAGRLVVRQPGRAMIGVVLRHERLTVVVPPAVTALAGSIHSQNGGARIEADRLERLEVRLHNGAARIRVKQAAELEAHSVNGAVDVRVGEAQSVRATSHNGRVDVAGGALRLDADAGNGRLTASPAGLAADATWRLNTGNGNLQVEISDPTVGVRARLRSAVSGVTVDVPDGDVRWLRRGVVGAEAEVMREAGAGSPTVEILAKATNGKVAVAQTGEATQEAAQ